MPDSPLFQVGDRVLDRARKFGEGEILGEPELELGRHWYRVRFQGGATEELAEEDIEPVIESDESIEGVVRAGRWGRLDALRLALAVERVSRESRDGSTVYSYNSQRIQFQPHQYKPLLKFLGSEDRRLLIADEVGLGKTIEAGLILAELEAREQPERVLVVCPSRLTEKWRQEMSRKFDQEFEVWDTRRLEDYARRVSSKPHLGRMRAVMSQQALRSERALELMLHATGSLDLLIVDEAHHARNRGTATFQMVEELAGAAGAVLLLTATPVHLSGEDLFNQLQLLRPGEFRDSHVFQAELLRNEGILRALERIRTRNPNKLNEAREELINALDRTEEATDGSSYVSRILERLSPTKTKTDRDWVELERMVDRLHFLSHVLTRTRKREVDASVAKRTPQVISVKWSQTEWDLYELIAGRKPANPNDTPKRLGIIQRERMAASSIWGTLFHRDDSFLGSEALDLDDVSDGLATWSGIEQVTPASLPPTSDAKLQALLDLLDNIRRNDGGAKVLIFTYFVGTSRYLEQQLNASGWSATRIAGDVPTHRTNPERDERAKRVERFRTDPNVQVLVSTEVGSEGLDFQFCHVLVNYDLPWNPMVVEQRIGRLDRFGQESDRILIYNLVVEGTIEERILARLYDRVGIFERSIGPLEGILGEVMNDLLSAAFSSTLTPAELSERVEEKAFILEKRVQETAALEQQADRLFGHEATIREELERVRSMGRYVTPANLRSVVDGYLDVFHRPLRTYSEEDNAFALELNENVLQDIRRRLSASQGVGEPDAISHLRRFTRERRYRFALEGGHAYARKDLDLLNASHPLVRAAVHALEAVKRSPVDRTGKARLTLSRDELDDVPEGTVALAVRKLSIRGLRDLDLIEVVGWSESQAAELPWEASGRLLHVAVSSGEEWLGESRPLSEAGWRGLSRAARSRRLAIEDEHRAENKFRVDTRRRHIKDELDRQISIAHRQRATAEQSGKLKLVEPLARSREDKAQDRYQQALLELEGKDDVQVTMSEPLAVLLVEVRRQ